MSPPEKLTVGLRAGWGYWRGAKLPTALAAARVADTIRKGVVWAPSIWWSKLAVDGRNANDKLSSIVVKSGCTARLYEHAGYGTLMTTLSAGSYSFIGGSYNDRATSIEITGC